MNATTVKHRVGDGATCFPTDQAVYKALCDIGAAAGQYSIRKYVNEGWFAIHNGRNEWLKIEEPDKADIKSEMRTVFALPIVRVMLDSLGPSDLLLAVAEAMRQRGIEEYAKTKDAGDVTFWRIGRKAIEVAVGEIDKALQVPPIGIRSP